MPTSPLARLERGLMLVLSVFALALACWMLAAPRWQLADGERQLALVETWSLIVLRDGLGPIALALPLLTAFTALLAAGVAVALSVFDPAELAVRRLRRALALGTLAALYFFHVRLDLPELAANFRAFTDVGAYGLAGWAIAELTGFLTTYPHPVGIEQLRAQVRDNALAPAYSNRLHRFRVLAFDATYRYLARGLNKLGFSIEVDFSNEQRIEHDARTTERFLHFLAGPLLRLCLIGLALIAGTCFALSNGDDGFDTVAVCLNSAAILVPIWSISGLHANYRFGSDADRRRIGWIYLGPALGFFAGGSIYFALMFWFITRGAAADTVFGMPLSPLWFASTVLMIPWFAASFVFGLAFAIFYHGTLNPRLMIRRGAIVTLTGVLLTAFFVAIEGAVSSQVVLRFGLPNSTGAVVAGTLAAVLFAPLRRQVDRRVDRLVNAMMPARVIADGEPRTLSVCFIDLCGYTALTERNQHEALLHAGLLHKCARAVAERHGGALVKTLGDAVMLRLSDPDSALSAIRELAADYRRGAEALDIAPLPLHAGLHHGEVVVSRDGDLFGSGVNLASRLLAAADAGSLLLSEPTNALLTAAVAMPRGELTLKNIAGPVAVRAVALAPGT